MKLVHFVQVHGINTSHIGNDIKSVLCRSSHAEVQINNYTETNHLGH